MFSNCLQIVVVTAAILMHGTSGQFQCLTSTNVSCIDGDYRGRRETVETRLLFSMNFTCHGTIVGWTVTGERIERGTQYPELQVWRANASRGSDYYKPGPDIPVDPDGAACEIVTQTCDQIFQCRLTAANQVSVQRGDILGVELPQLTNSGFHLYFTSIPGTQDHFIYRQRLSSSVHTSTHQIRQFDDQLLISLEVEQVPPATTESNMSTTSTMKEPTTTINESLTTENISTTTMEGANTTIPTDGQQLPIIKEVTCSQSAATGLIIGVAIGGVLIGVLITLTATVIIVAFVCLAKKNENTLTLLAVNRRTQGINEYDDDMEMKDVEEPLYSVILPNPTVRDSQMDMKFNVNECYATAQTSTSVAAP